MGEKVGWLGLGLLVVEGRGKRRGRSLASAELNSPDFEEIEELVRRQADSQPPSTKMNSLALKACLVRILYTFVFSSSSRA